MEGRRARLPQVALVEACRLGYVDEVIEPELTRLRLVRGLELLKNRRQTNPPRKHGNIPL